MVFTLFCGNGNCFEWRVFQMSILDKISKRLTSQGEDDYGYWIAVKCKRCGEGVRARVDLRNDLSAEYEGRKTTYRARKVLIGEGTCFQRIEVLLRFDDRRRLIERSVSGGEFYEGEE